MAVLRRARPCSSFEGTMWLASYDDMRCDAWIYQVVFGGVREDDIEDATVHPLLHVHSLISPLYSI